MPKALICWMLFCLPVFAPCAWGETGGKASTNAVLATCVRVKGCAVRFIFIPPDPPASFFPTPTIFRQARKHGPRTWAWTILSPQGLTQWISPVGMQNFLEGLEKLNLSWEVTRNPMSFRRVRIKPAPPPPELPWKTPLPRKEGMMEIDVTSGAGSAVALLASKKVCASMSPLAYALHNPIAIYHFISTLVYWGCMVPGYKAPNYGEPSKHERR